MSIKKIVSVACLGVLLAPLSFGQTAIKLEAEDGVLVNNEIDTEHAGFSGTGFVDGTQAGSITWTLGSEFAAVPHLYSARAHMSCNVSTFASCGVNGFVTKLDNKLIGEFALNTGDWKVWDYSPSESVIAKAGQTLVSEEFGPSAFPGNLDFLEFTLINSPPTTPTLTEQALGSTDPDSDEVSYGISAGEDKFEIVEGNLTTKSGVEQGSHDVTVFAYHTVLGGTDTLKSADTTFSITVSAGNTSLDIVPTALNQVVTVYDLKGSVVSEFVSTSHSSSWNGITSLGNRAQAGVYFLQVGEQSFDKWQKVYWAH